MVIVGHMSSKSTFGAKNTGQKFLTPKNFWWCRNVCPDSCPGVIFGAGRGGALFFRGGAGRGGAELKIFGAGAARGSHFPRGRGGAGRGVHPCWKLLLMQTLSSSFHPPRPLCQIKTASKEVVVEEEPLQGKTGGHLTTWQNWWSEKLRRFKY